MMGRWMFAFCTLVITDKKVMLLLYQIVIAVFTDQLLQPNLAVIASCHLPVPSQPLKLVASQLAARKTV